MKLCMVSNHNIKDKLNWSGTPLSLYSSLTRHSNIDISTIDLSQHISQFDIKLNAIKNCNIKQTIKQKAFAPKLGPASNNPLYSKKLEKLCKNQNFDAVLEFGGFKTSKIFPPYYVYTDSSHDMKLDYYQKYGYLPFGSENDKLDDVKKAADYARDIYRNAQGVLCMSQWLADIMINTTGVNPDKVYTVYAGANWHDSPPPNNIKPKSISNKNEIHLLLTGVSYLGKGVDIACEAVDILNKESDLQYYLHICGIKEDFNHSENIINHGFVTKTELTKHLKSCDLFVLPTRFDCFGISYIEAMAYGLPCIGRNICAVPEIIDEGKCGELIIDDNAQHLADSISKICSNENLYSIYSANAIEKAKRFTWERVASDIMDIIKT